ncbi:MAG: hypothetical protein V3V44_04735 [Anaerolineales bacterium]
MSIVSSDLEIQPGMETWSTWIFTLQKRYGRCVVYYVVGRPYDISINIANVGAKHSRGVIED